MLLYCSWHIQDSASDDWSYVTNELFVSLSYTTCQSGLSDIELLISDMYMWL